jgi:hypothetical protein
MDKLIPLDLPPGMRNTGTVYQSKNRWYTGNLVRFFQDTIQPIGGWSARSLTIGAVTYPASIVFSEGVIVNTSDVQVEADFTSTQGLAVGDTITVTYAGGPYIGICTNAATSLFVFYDASNPDLAAFLSATASPATLTITTGNWTWTPVAGMSGVPRAMLTYRINAQSQQVIVIGTTAGLFAIQSGAVYNITPTGFSTNASLIWELDVFGSWLIANTYIIGNTSGGPAYYWTGDVNADAAALSPFTGTRPLAVKSILGTPERFMVVLGAAYTASGWADLGKNATSRLVTWATQEGGFDSADWTPASNNTAGDFELTTDGALVCGRRSRGTTLLWTTTDLWTMTYIGGDFVFRFDQAANACGIISSHAAVVTNVGAFWMGENGFFKFEGFVSPVPCDVQDYVFGSINRSYTGLIWALENPMFGEVTWFYPHAGQTEITRYVTYSYIENHWVTGTLSRTAGISSQPGLSGHVFPVMCNAAGSVFNHETGTGRNSEGTPSLESGPLEIEDGDRLLSIQKVIPDDKTVGDVNLTIFTAPNPDTAETSNGPYTLTAQTSVRLKARQIRVKLTEAVAAAWRVGKIRLGVLPSSRR